jgi:hypothetical protein
LCALYWVKRYLAYDKPPPDPFFSSISVFAYD